MVLDRLANKYRPTKFEDVCDQEVCTKVLSKQIAKKSYSNVILFVGSAGCGKTTCAKIFANEINAEIIELDCAKNGGVAEIKEICEKARIKPLIKDLKVFILDECQCITKEGWSSMLITLEEKIPSAIFIFCTTDPQKIPNTILSRCMRLNFTPITDAGMKKRLTTVCDAEHIVITDDAMDYIIASAKGSLRQALTNIDTCLLYEELQLDVATVCKVLNMVSLDVLADICEAYKNKDQNKLIDLIEAVYNNGYELHYFTRQLLDYCVTKNRDVKLMETLLTTLQDIRYDDSPKNIIIARLIV